jgi:hypothetical protein
MMKHLLLLMLFIGPSFNGISQDSLRASDTNYFHAQLYPGGYFEHPSFSYPDSLYEKGDLMSRILSGHLIYEEDTLMFSFKPSILNHDLLVFSDSLFEILILRVEIVDSLKSKVTRYFSDGTKRYEGFIMKQAGIRLMDYTEGEDITKDHHAIDWVKEEFENSIIFTGPWVSYHDNGAIFSQGVFGNVVIIGAGQVLLEPGWDNVVWEYSHPYTFDATKLGRWDYFDRDNKPILMEHFENGFVVSYVKLN